MTKDDVVQDGFRDSNVTLDFNINVAAFAAKRGEIPVGVYVA